MVAVVGSRLVRLNAGGRAAGTSQAAEDEALGQVLRQRRADLRAEVLEEFTEQHHRQQRAVVGLDSTLESLRRGQVGHLMLRVSVVT
jgi:hypothetical protein